ncbi:hypothetical protein [Chitinophaga sp. Cy-1792]|uniref:hypothetical protein n=1 Tax=Chitinophaga sp. Cy-1792 TaxID=2608339 RepID=UPI00141FB8B2|nr:hypothetical protein [Chitinophaga sp. Cy-1792]NIG53922.1 hypothetical protein [Chitinophaga sp. Cy-1792]
MSYKIPVFLSYPKPYNKAQEIFITKVSVYLESRGMVGRTLGVTDYDIQEPLTAIRRLMLESNGLITIALRRNLIINGKGKPDSDIGEKAYDLNEQWFTSPYCQIEPAMAFQIGLPILIFREKGVVAEGLLEKGVIGNYMPEIDIDRHNQDDNFDRYFAGHEWQQTIGTWEALVRTVVVNKGKPPKLF